MYPTKPSNTQVYSPLGSFVVEQRDKTDKYDQLKRRYEGDAYRWEKGIALSWLLLFVFLIGGSIYNRFGKPEIVAASPAVIATSSAEAAITTTVGSASNPSED